MGEEKELEIENMFEGEKYEPKKMESPSSINTYHQCPRKYFYQYIQKIKVKPNIHMVKGTIIHKTLEDFYKKYDENLREHLMSLFKTTWDKHSNLLKSLELSDEELIEARLDCVTMIEDYYITFKRKLKNLIDRDKANDERHAFFLLRPKFREMFVKNEDLHCLGYIDRVHKDIDGMITLGDYKTSSRYGIGVPEDYVRQLSIYSLLYYLQEKTLPNFASIIFLRYGEEPMLMITPSVLRYARDTIIDTYKKTRSVNIDDYPLKENKLCSWCNFLGKCSGEDSFQAKKRVENIKKELTLSSKSQDSDGSPPTIKEWPSI